MSKADPIAIERETGLALMPKFDASGLVTAVVCDTASGLPLMVAFMNEEALQLSVATGEGHFYSRSRQEIWHKGGTSGNVLTIDEMRVDCDQDAIWMSVTPQGHGAACHTGQKSCFYRRVVTKDGDTVLEHTGDTPLFDPKDVY
jgi:phosphoribosyl-AMP cyclohydrolase